MLCSEIFKEKTHRNGFYNIMPIENLTSVLEHGILSYEAISDISHSSIAMNTIQKRRENVQIPNGLALHQYANVYFDARNPMMYKRKNQADKLCIIKVSCKILDLPDVVVADQNASSKYVRFYEPEKAFDKLNYNYIYADSWTDEDSFVYYEKKCKKCAEVLVPYKIEPKHFIAIAVKSKEIQSQIENMVKYKVHITPDLFFC